MTATTTSHAEGSEFIRGLRPFFEYRDLGIKGATDGAFGAHVIKLAETTALFCLKSASRQFGDLEIFIFVGGI